jgi:hypothetical protein
MMPAAGPPMALSQIPAQPQPATPTVQPTIAPTLLRGQNRPEVRSQLHQRRLRRSSNLYIQGASARAIWRISGLRHTDSRVVYYSWRAGPWVVRAERGRGCEQSEAGAARVGQCVIRSEVSLFELVFVIAPTAGRNLAVSWSCTANGEGGTSGSLGKHEPRIDAAFARYVGPASLKPIPTLSR